MAEILTPEICVIGGGPGGIAAATEAAALGIPVLLVEKGRMGGANFTSGGVPSKALLAAANLYENLRRGPAVGVTGAPLQVNLGKVRDHIAAVSDAIAPNIAAERLAAMGVKVLSGAAHFADPRTVMVGEQAISARRYILAVGAKPAPPEIAGLDSIEYMTAESAFDVARKPAHLLILGADWRGLELAQAYARLGVDVTVIEEGEALASDDPELSTIVLDRLRAEGIRIRTGVKIEGVARRRNGIRLNLGDLGEDTHIDGSHLLVAVGRAPNIGGLGLEIARINYDRNGIWVDNSLRTTNRRVYAIGDVVAGPALVSRAEADAAAVMKAILYRWPSRPDPSSVPAVAFTDPALASVGLNETVARERYKAIRVLRQPFVENDRAEIERQPAGLIKVITTTNGRILGAAIVGRDAGELIATWSLAVAKRLTVDDILSAALPYPTRADIARRVALTFHASGFTPTWRRRVIDLLRKFG